jgi:hypothetical protein
VAGVADSTRATAGAVGSTITASSGAGLAAGKLRLSSSWG